MPTLQDLVHHVGPMLVDSELVADGEDVTQLCIPAPGGPVGAGDLVLGTWVRGQDEAADLITTAATAGAAAVMIDFPAVDALRVLARRTRVGLAVKAITANWADVFRALETALSSADAATGTVSADTLHVLSDQGMALLGGPITIEDLSGNVLAHSHDQHGVDEARRDAIINRSTAPDRLDRLHGLGVYQALAGGADQVMVPAVKRVDGPASGSDQQHRLVLPVTAIDGALVGSVWVARSSPLPASELTAVHPWLQTVAHHIGPGREPGTYGPVATARALRSVLHQAPVSDPLDLGTPPWVVGVIGCTVRSADVQLSIWHSLFQRRGWRTPLLTSVDAGIACVLQEESTGPGSVDWWASQLDEALADPESTVAVGTRAMSTAELRRSHDAAQELTRTVRLWPELATTVLWPDRHWAEVSLLRFLEGHTDPPTQGPAPLHDLLQLDDYLLTTLWEYLSSGGSIPRTAGALTIHPNTLRYRLDKLRATGLDLDRPIVRQALHLQLLALRARDRS